MAAQRVGARNQAWAPIQPRTSIAAAVPAPEVGVGHNTARRQSPSAMSTLGSTVRLVKADAAGRLRFWSVQCQENSTTVEYGLVRASEAGSTIVKMHATPAAEKQSHRATSEDPRCDRQRPLRGVQGGAGDRALRGADEGDGGRGGACAQGGSIPGGCRSS